MNIFAKKPPAPPHTPQFTQVFGTRSYNTNKYNNPANPVRNKTQKKLNIQPENYKTTSINNELIEHEINPLNVVKDIVQTELVDEVQILKFNEQLRNSERKLRGDYSYEISDYYTKKKDDDLRINLAYNYSTILLSFLKNVRNISVETKSVCGEVLRFITGFDMMFTNAADGTEKTVGMYYWNMDFPNAVRGKLGGNNHVFFDLNDIQQKLPGLLNPDYYINQEKYEDTMWALSSYFNGYGNSAKVFETIRNEFSKCKNQYYLIPIQYYQKYANDTGNGGHQNLLLLDKLNEAAVYIEPQFYGSYNIKIQQESGRIHNTIDRVLKELNIPEYKHVIPVTPYPQSIADDDNCMFWTFLITVNYIINSKSISPDKIATAIIKKYPTRKQLLEYIEGFKEKLHFYIEAMKKLKGDNVFAGKRKPKRKTMRKRTRKSILN